MQCTMCMQSTVLSTCSMLCVRAGRACRCRLQLHVAGGGSPSGRGVWCCSHSNVQDMHHRTCSRTCSKPRSRLCILGREGPRCPSPRHTQPSPITTSLTTLAAPNRPHSPHSPARGSLQPSNHSPAHGPLHAPASSAVIARSSPRTSCRWAAAVPPGCWVASRPKGKTCEPELLRDNMR